MQTLTPCHGLTDLFYSDEPENIEIAKEFCGGCPLKARCLQGAMERNEPCGVWGGKWIRDGRSYTPKKRGRPVRAEQAA
jgi:WhiB family redox-sensing transcriptional regulator